MGIFNFTKKERKKKEIDLLKSHSLTLMSEISHTLDDIDLNMPIKVIEFYYFAMFIVTDAYMIAKKIQIMQELLSMNFIWKC
jgi:hypothetical protein